MEKSDIVKLTVELKKIELQYLAEGLSVEVIRNFCDSINIFYTRYPRHFPWRETSDPYATFVSEIMLQQTQADRVVAKYIAFLQAFPTVQTLAQSSTSELLILWQGLGYSRRALNLKRAAQIIMTSYSGVVPQGLTDLLALPGIGPYTAGAIRAFAFDLPGEVIDTNIRRVYLHTFFSDIQNVPDSELTPYILATQDFSSSRRWYSALMDVGNVLPKVTKNANTRSKHYTKQAPLAGSNREVRGMILRLLSMNKNTELSVLPHHLNLSVERISVAVKQLIEEGFIEQNDQSIQLHS